MVVKAGSPEPVTGKLTDDTGRVRFGPEYLRVVNYQGETLTQVPWLDRSGFTKGDKPGIEPKRRKFEDYNRQSRNLLGIAHIDGKTPHIIVVRGTYGKMKVAAYKFSNKTLKQVWYWENQRPYNG